MKKLLLLILLLLIVPAGALFFLISTESGLSFIVGQVNRWHPAGITIESSEGRLSGPFSITNLELTSAEGTVSIESLQLDWRLPALWRRAFTIRSAQVDKVRVDWDSSASPPPEATESSGPITLPDTLALPIDVAIEQLRVSDIRLVTSAQGEPIELQSVTASAHYSREETADLRVVVVSEWLMANAALSADTRSSYPMNGNVAWTLKLPELAPMVGKLDLTGDLESLKITHVTEAPYGVHITAIANQPLAELMLEVSGSVSSTDLSTIRADLPPIGITNELAFNGSPTKGDARLTTVVTGLLPDPVNVTLVSQIDNQLLTIESLDMTIDDSSTTIATHGTIDLANPDPVLDLELTWSDAQWPLNSSPIATSQSGTIKVAGPIDQVVASVNAEVGEQGRVAANAHRTGDRIALQLNWDELSWPLDGSQVNQADGVVVVDGTIDDYTLTVNSVTDLASMGAVELMASGTGSAEQLRLPLIKGSALEGEFDGQANVTWAPQLSLLAKLEGDGFDPSSFSSELPGDLALMLDISGKTVNDILNVSLNELSVTGELRQLPLSMKAVGHTIGNQLTIDRFTIDSGPTSLAAEGVIADDIALSWKLDSPDLSTLYPQSAGQLSGNGKIHGSMPLPSIDAMLSGTAIEFGEIEIASVDAKASVDASTAGKIDVKINVDKAVGPRFSISSFKTLATGSMEDHVINVSGRSEQGDIDLNVNGQFNQPTWNYEIDRLKLAPADLAPWTLVTPASGQLGSGNVRLKALCLESGKAQLCTNVQQSEKSLVADYQLNKFPMSYIKSFVPDGMQIKGSLDSDGRWDAPISTAPSAKLNVALSALTLDISGPDEDLVRVLTLEPSSINADLDAQGLTSNALLDLGSQGRLNATVAASGTLDTLTEGDLTGSLTGSIDNIGFVAALVPDIESVAGRIRSDIRIGGTMRRPSISGGIELGAGSVNLTTPGLLLEDIEATIKAQGGTKLGLNASAKSGDGQLSVKGTVDLADESPELSVSVNGKDFSVLNTLEARAAISPSLDILVRKDRLFFNGDVDIPLLEITPKKIPTGVVGVSADQTIVSDEPDIKRLTPISVQGTVNVSLGDQVSVDAFGLKAKLSGDVRIKESPGTETTATGKLTIDEGTFKAYGQNLRVQNGQVLYAGGPISQPGFDIEAVRNVTSEIQVGVRARGAIKQPKFSLFSTPSMTESEQMSYLVLGRPLEDNSPSENSAVRQAAMALGVAGGKLLTEKFGNKLGLDQVSIGSELRETGEQAALVVGKYLSPKLFVSYGVGLFEPVSTLRLNYTVSRNVKLVTETTESRSGGDIVFTFDSGK